MVNHKNTAEAEIARGEYTISTDPSRLNIDLIHDFICNHSYWGKGRARDVVERSIENSMAFGVYQGESRWGSRGS